MFFPGNTLSKNGWPTPYSRAEITKRLVIVGKGNWLDTSSFPKGNFGYQATKGVAIFENDGTDVVSAIFFFFFSAGSVLMGFDGQGQTIWVGCNDLTLKGNFNFQVFLSNNVSINSNLTVEKNYRVSFSGDNSNDIQYINFIIKNNLIFHLQLPQHAYKGAIINNTWAVDRTGTPNNGGEYAMSFYNTGCGNGCTSIEARSGTWLFENNLLIFYQNAASNTNYFYLNGLANSTVNNNVMLQSTNITTWPGTGSGNVSIQLADATNIFEAFPAILTSSADARYRLKGGSPAKAGSALRPTATVDAGMFGGPTPYKLSTIPSIPTIYSISSPQGNTIPAGNSIQINVSTRSNN